MATIFDSVKVAQTKSSTFDLSHDVKLSLNMGELVPILCMETIPGDRFNIAAESLLRFQPLVSPVMHQMNATMHYFFVPNRILWENWENFITNTKVNGVLPAFPTIDLQQNAANPGQFSRLADYLGIPNSPAGVGIETVSAVPFAAYQKVYQDYYRDQNLIPEVINNLTDGNNGAQFQALTTLRTRAWEHDYFTSALPFAQKGDAVSIPLGSVELDNNWNNPPGSPDPTFRRGDGSGLPTLGGNIKTDGSFGIGEYILSSNDINNKLAYDPAGSLTVEPTTINDLRQAFSLQKWLEKMARGGSRMIEVIKSHFGVTSSDARLNRPEYITGTKAPVVISEVLNMTGTDQRPQGDMAGHGISVTNSKNGSYYCEEHGYIIGIMSVMAKPAYMQGIAKHFLKNDPLDYAWPDFAHLGEQPVLNKELYAYLPTGNNTFGYVPRYAEYKFEPSRVAGDFRTNLDFWHLARKFANQPQLNQQFIECDSTETDRIFAVTDPDVQKLLCHVFNQVKVIRKLPKFGTPTF